MASTALGSPDPATEVMSLIGSKEGSATCPAYQSRMLSWCQTPVIRSITRDRFAGANPWRCRCMPERLSPICISRLSMLGEPRSYTSTTPTTLPLPWRRRYFR
jgi:hypothetical protein